MSVDKKPLAAAVLVLFALSLITACSLEPDRVTRENYDRLKMGMSYEEVAGILGAPADASTRFGLEQFTWVEKDRHIHAKFLADNAVYYSCKNLDEAPAKGTKPHGR